MSMFNVCVVLLIATAAIILYLGLVKSAGSYGEYHVCDIKVTYLFYQERNKDEFQWDKSNNNLLIITAYRTCAPPPEVDGTLEVYRKDATIVETKGGILWEDSSYL